MYIKVLPLLLLLSVGLSNSQALAQGGGGYKIRKDALEKVQWYHAPREIQILDDRPVINDMRGGQPSSMAPSAAPMSLNGTPLNAAPLPKSGFGASNIPIGGFAAGKPLPAGSSTNMLAGKMAKPQAMGRPGSLLKSTRGSQAAMQPMSAGPARTATYGGSYSAPSGGGMGGGSTQSSTSVSGRITRGSLLKH